MYTLWGAHAEAVMLILLFLSWNNTTTQQTLPSQVVQRAASACESPHVLFAATVSLCHSRPVDCGGRVKLKKKIPSRPHPSNYTRCCLDIWTRLCVPWFQKHKAVILSRDLQPDENEKLPMSGLFVFLHSLINHVVQPEARPQDTQRFAWKCHRCKLTQASHACQDQKKNKW